MKKLMTEWHRAFISINETLGGLEDKKARSEAGEKVFVGALMAQTGGGGGMSPKAKNNLIVLILIIVVVGVVGYFFGDVWISSFQQLFRGR